MSSYYMSQKKQCGLCRIDRQNVILDIWVNTSGIDWIISHIFREETDLGIPSESACEDTAVSFKIEFIRGDSSDLTSMEDVDSLILGCDDKDVIWYSSGPLVSRVVTVITAKSS